VNGYSFRRRWRFVLILAESLVAVYVVSCGGGSSGSSSPGPAGPQGFSISASPSNQSIGRGQSAAVTVSVIPQGGFEQTISVAIDGLPAGVIASPGSPFTMGIAGQSVSFTVSPAAAIGSSTITFHGSGGGLSSAASVTLSITQATSQNRTTFVRTDETPLGLVFDAAHQTIFSSALALNCVDVIPLASQQVAQCIPVSGPIGLSMSADGTEILVGTEVGMVDWINTTSLQVVRRDVIPSATQSQGAIQGVFPAQAYQAANGKVLLFSTWGYDFFSNFTQSVGVVEWDPVAGTSTVRTDSGGGGVVSTSADHTKLLVAGGSGERI
jgi:hypothetical protein